MAVMQLLNAPGRHRTRGPDTDTQCPLARATQKARVRETNDPEWRHVTSVDGEQVLLSVPEDDDEKKNQKKSKSRNADIIWQEVDPQKLILFYEPKKQVILSKIPRGQDANGC